MQRPTSDVPAVRPTAGPDRADPTGTPTWTPTGDLAEGSARSAGGAPGADRRMAQRWRWPLVGLAVVVAVAILAAAVLLIRRPHAAATTAIDACVAGTWHVTKYAEQLTVAGIGPVTFRGTDPGATLRLGRDGKGLVDYGAGTTFTSAVAVAGQQVGIKLVLAGTVTYDFRTNGGIISFTRVAATGTTTTTTTTGRSQSEALKGSTDPAQYACEGDGLTTYTAAYRAEMRRG